MIVEHFGHWKVLNTPQMKREGGIVDLSKYIGFVYVISFSDGTKYIGAKKIWKRITRPPNTFKRGPNKGFEQSDWRSYTSSSSVVNERIENGVLPTEYLIVGFYDTWGKTLYAEATLQIKVNIFEPMDGKYVWLNFQIEGMFTKSCWDLTIPENVDYYYDHITRKTDNNSVFWNEIHVDVCLDGKDIIGQPMVDLMPYNDFIKLIEGKVDEVHGISLSNYKRRRSWKFKYNDKYYDNQKSIMDDLNITKEELSKLDIQDNKIESRTEYIKRLSKEPVELKILRRFSDGKST